MYEYYFLQKPHINPQLPTVLKITITIQVFMSDASPLPSQS